MDLSMNNQNINNKIVINNNESQLLINKKKLILNKIKDHKIALYDVYRKLSIKNIEELYNYEVSLALADYQRDYNELTNVLINKEINNQVDNNIHSSNDKKVNKIKSNDNNSNVFKNHKRKSIVDYINKSINKEDIKSDLKEILNETHSNNTNEIKRYKQINAAVNNGELVIDNDSYHIGDNIVITSNRSNESFLGFISIITETTVIVRCVSGHRCSFTITDLIENRINISIDEESKEYNSLIIQASDIINKSN